MRMVGERGITVLQLSPPSPNYHVIWHPQSICVLGNRQFDQEVIDYRAWVIGYKFDKKGIWVRATVMAKMRPHWLEQPRSTKSLLGLASPAVLRRRTGDFSTFPHPFLCLPIISCLLHVFLFCSGASPQNSSCYWSKYPLLVPIWIKASDCL